jgi:non-canonical (house-cleaning) NTP pyrophosphatase
MRTYSIMLGSTNETKLAALKDAVDSLQEFLGTSKIQTMSVEGNPNPIDDEVKAGAILRAEKALERLNLMSKYEDDIFLGVGIEGGIVHVQDVPYITAYCHAISDAGESHGAWSAFLECPPSLMDGMQSTGKEMGVVVDEMRAKFRLPWRGGAFGTLTAERYSRQTALKDAMILAFSPFFITFD